MYLTGLTMTAVLHTRRRLRQLSVAAALLSLLAISFTPVAAQEVEPEFDSIWQVVIETDEDIRALVDGGWDLVEARGSDHLLVVGKDAVADELRSQGYTVRLDRVLDSPNIFGDSDGDVDIFDFYGGYRTVDEHVTHLIDVAAAYPDLTTLHDYGDSWRAQVNRSDNDLLAICITNKQPGDCALNPDATKPRAMIMAAIHARELQTAEVAWRLIDELTGLYGIDADITHILDTTEVWVIPVANPDGREIVQLGGNNPWSQRKNGNDTLGDCLFPATWYDQHGVDLNRNATWGWGGVGASTDPCGQTYRGTSAASEPEQSSLEALFADLWPDQKGPLWDDPVASDATGSFISIHSFGELILLPTGENGQPSPNDDALRAFGFRMANWNQYVVGTGEEILYAVSGTTDDHVYYTLGVPGFTYELSPRSGVCSGFFPPYPCIDNEIWPENRDALLYSLKVAGAPYTEPLGPTTLSVTASEPGQAAGAPVTVVATANDDAYGNASGSFGRPTAGTVTSMEYWLDSTPSDGPGTAMTPSDGQWDEAVEDATLVISSAALNPGTHSVLVRARNSAGYWGPITATSFVVQATLGDVDGDGNVDSADVIAILDLIAAGVTQPPNVESDLDENGTLDLFDALLLARQIGGL